MWTFFRVFVGRLAVLSEPCRGSVWQSFALFRSCFPAACLSVLTLEGASGVRSRLLTFMSVARHCEWAGTPRRPPRAAPAPSRRWTRSSCWACPASAAAQTSAQQPSLLCPCSWSRVLSACVRCALYRKLACAALCFASLALTLKTRPCSTLVLLRTLSCVGQPCFTRSLSLTLAHTLTLACPQPERLG